MDVVAWPASFRWYEGLYVAVVAALTAVAMLHPNEVRGGLLAAAVVLALPAMVLGLPVLYLAGAAIWNITGADHGGREWPVTFVYTVVLAATAAVNVMVVRLLRTRRFQ